MHGHECHKKTSYSYGSYSQWVWCYVFFILFNAPYETHVTPHGICYMLRELQPLFLPQTVDKLGKFQA